MDRILFEDGNGNLMDEEGTEVSVIEMEVDVEEFSLGEITNYDIYIDLKPPEKPVKIKHEENDTASEEEKKIIKQGITDYTNPMSKIFFYLVYEKGSGIRVAAKELKVSQSSAQIWMSKAKQAGDDGFVGRRSGGGRPEGRPSILDEGHKDFLVNLIGEKPSIVLNEMMESLTDQFFNLQIKMTALYNSVTKKCNINLERAHLHAVDRNSPEKIQARHRWVEVWSETDMDYLSN
ncbi:hypothetical protein G6F56_003544 [Rhizopus delemar]|nr:hypothetical protein G6F56_003544 [Rhizopus delemar]